MPETKTEKLIRLIYKRWKAGYSQAEDTHPGIEDMACFLEDRLSPEESKGIKAHLVKCLTCSDVLSAQLKAEADQEIKAPDKLLNWAKNIYELKAPSSLLEIALKLKENILELIKTSGSILIPQGDFPGPVLREPTPQEFQDEIRIFKDFNDIRVEVTIENKQGRAFNVTILAKNKNTQETIKDLRISLLKNDRELESYVTDSGKVVFEQALIGKYSVELTSPGQKLASIILDIRNL